ncbi:hypothetical protein B0O80DRAFT_451906 [Mortierella sp. GBAus27b]|nr:hypothetical protein B0O80DRAFT_451906 [Mortierella sp. GBAus27b]
MILAATFSPFNETELMGQIFEKGRLRRIRSSLVTKLDPIDLDDKTIQNAIRLKMNNDQDAAEDMLDSLEDRSLRSLFRDLIHNVPRKEVPTSSEFDLISNYIAPILRSCLHKPDEDVRTTFPNTESLTQKNQGLSADKPDFVLMVGDKEMSFGEVTGYRQRTDHAKSGVDLWRLVRFGSSVIHEGAPMVPLLQVIYDDATLYRLFPHLRGVLVLAEVGAISFPTHARSIGSLQVSFPVLQWYKEAIVFLENHKDWGRRSWKTSDLAHIKKFLK